MHRRSLMTSEKDILLTNDVCDEEGQPADNEHTHHGSQSFCSFRLFRDPCHEKILSEPEPAGLICIIVTHLDI